MPDPSRTASALSPILFALGDPDLLLELLSSSPAGVVLVEAGPDLRVVYCNQAFQRWVPLGRRPILGSSLPDLFTWADREAVRSGYREAIGTGYPVHLRWAPYHRDHVPDGRFSQWKVAHWNVSHYPLRVPAGRVSHVLSFAVDLTDWAGATAQMDGAQQRVLTALGGITRHLTPQDGPDAFMGEIGATFAQLASARRAVVMLHDPATQTVSAQAGGYGFAPAELERLGGIPCRRGGRSLIERVVFDDLVVREDVDPADPGYGPYGAALTVLGVHSAVSIPWHAGQRRLGAVTVCDSSRPSGFSEEDVWVLQAAATSAALVWEHRQADRTAADMRDRESARLRQQIEQSIELEQLKANFLSLASHELRGPLAVVRGYVSMMEDGTLGEVGEQVETVLPVVRAKLDEMNRLINEMLETARLEDSALQLDLARLDLRDVVHDAVRSLEPLADARHRLVSSIPGGVVPVVGDRSRLTMIVSNLVHNALKYSPAGGEIRVTCEVDGETARVAVRDEGLGIASEDQERLFTRFGRIVNQGTADITGTGLGLYLSRDLARRHGGDVDVVSASGLGSTFTLSLPLAPEE